MKKIIQSGMVISAALLLGTTSATADNRVKSQNEAVKNEQEASKYDHSNSGINVRDRNENRLTADDQSNSKNDTEIAAKVRASLLKDNSLSTLAQNVKIITQNGVVTLRGPVRNLDERKLIESRAVQVVGLNNVRNELEIDSK